MQQGQKTRQATLCKLTKCIDLHGYRTRQALSGYQQRGQQYSFRVMQTSRPPRPHQLCFQEWVAISRLRVFLSEVWTPCLPRLVFKCTRQSRPESAQTWITVETLFSRRDAPPVPQSYTGTEQYLSCDVTKFIQTQAKTPHNTQLLQVVSWPSSARAHFRARNRIGME